MSLERYQQKRDFTRTPEPAGSVPGPAPGAGGGRFVVQRHRARRLHYDFRLEIDGVLASWAVPRGPTLDPAARRMAVHVEDHPLGYFDFEGLIPAGEYGAGDVIVWDWGRFSPEGSPDPAAAVRAGELKFRLEGRKLRGSFVLVRTRAGGRGGREGREDWLLIKHRDADAAPGWDPEAQPRSVKTGRTNDEVRAGAPARIEAAPPPVGPLDQPSGGLSAEPPGSRRAPMPAFVEPMKATLADRPFSDPAWLFEVKWDGYRVEAVVRDGRVRLWTRNGQDAAAYFPELAGPPTWIGAGEAIVDGEVVALDEAGLPRFSLLQERLGGIRSGGSRPGRLAYQVFDLLYLDGRSLLQTPLEERKRLLRRVLRDDPTVVYAGHVAADGEAFFAAAGERGLEGMVAKLRVGHYEPGRRSATWLKIKRWTEQEVVVGGWLPRRGSASDIGSLVVGVYDDGRLVPAGSVGSGLDARTRAGLLDRLRPLEQPTPPFDPAPRLGGVHWTAPRLVVRVSFAEWTRDGRLRQPTFRGLDPGRDPAAVRRERPTPTAAARRAARPIAASGPGAAPERGAVAEASPPGPEPPGPEAAVGEPTGPEPPVEEPPVEEPARSATPAELAALDALPASGTWLVGGHHLRLTNLDKVLFPEGAITKRDVVRYFAEIAPVLLPHLAGRPLNLHRFPDGATGSGFWQKDIPRAAPGWLRRWRETGVEGRGANTHLVADGVAALAWLANLAAFEIHAWTSTAEAPDRPSYALIDIDPGDRTTWDEVLALSRLYRAALAHLGVRGFPKVTGRRGIQVWIPVVPRYGFGEISAWVEALSRAVGSAVPDLVSWEWEKARRGGLARLDYTQNAPNKTLVAPYAVRPAPAGPVSAPIAWDELDDPALRPDGWTIRTILGRVRERGDLFAGALRDAQELPRL